MADEQVKPEEPQSGEAVPAKGTAATAEAATAAKAEVPAAGEASPARAAAAASPSPAGKNGVTRRQLLRSMMWGSVGVFFLESTAANLAFFWPRKVTGFGGKVQAGAVEDFEVGSVTKVAEGKFYLVRLKDGFVALYWKCPHLGCTVPWSPPEDPGRFHCPCHGSVYAETGQKLAGPAPRSMDIMAVEIVDGKVVIDTGKITERLNFSPSEITKV